MVMCPLTIGRCREEDCAWWNEDKSKCIVWVISESLEMKDLKKSKDMADAKK